MKIETDRSQTTGSGELAGVFRRRLISGSSVAVMLLGSAFAVAPAEASENSPPTLAEIDVPKVEELSDFVSEDDDLVVLGKALFWDMQVGSDGQACASCHFHAGADSRVQNQLAPGLRREGDPDSTFQPTRSGGRGGPNYTLVEEDFPFHEFADPDDRDSSVVFSTNDISSSQGTYGGLFSDEGAFDPRLDDCDRFADEIFHVGGVGVRKVEARQTPTVINAAFNFRNFWDGRANNVFNGVTPFGQRESVTIIGKDGSTDDIDLRNSSLASQAGAPPVDDFEMSCSQRTFADLGRKLLARRALATQLVHEDDSVLGSDRDETGLGLNKTYAELIKNAFRDDFWDEPGLFDGFSQMEANFSLFFALAVQAYQTELVSDEAPYDDFASGRDKPFDPEDGDQDALTESERRGLDVFLGKGNCVNCHRGGEFTAAGQLLQKEEEEGGLVERMYMGDGGIALYDTAFYNIGVTPTNEDLGVGGKDPFGNPLSFAEQFINDDFVDPIEVDPCTFDVPFDDDDDCDELPDNLSDERLAVRGASRCRRCGTSS